MELSNNTKRFFVFLSAFTVGLVLCVSHVAQIGIWVGSFLTTISPFILGACLAFVLSVPMHLFERILSKENKKGHPLLNPGVRRAVSLVLSILLIIMLISLFLIIVLPQIADTVSSLASSIMSFVPVAQAWITQFQNWLKAYPEIGQFINPYIPDVSQIASTIIVFVQKYAGILASTLVSNVTSIYGSAMDIVVSFVFAIYILLQKAALSRQLKKLVYAFLPKRFCDQSVRIAKMTHRTFFSYVTIQCTEALILGALCLLGMIVFRFPHALVISTIMLFCALIPIYGAIFSCIIGAFLVLIAAPSKALWFVLFILILQQIETNLIYPRVVSTSINLPSMWVLLAVTVGGGIFGIVGMLIAVPITSIAYTLLGEATHDRLELRGIIIEDHAQNP